jgi:hypothetical protein
MKKKQKPFHVNLWKWTLGAYIAFGTIPILLQQKYWVGGFEKLPILLTFIAYKSAFNDYG